MRQPTDIELDEIDDHIELTSDVEWIPHSFASTLAEEESDENSALQEFLRARHLQVLKSRTLK